MSPPPGAFRLCWIVFLSCRGTDTRDTFTKSLYNSLHAHGVRAFRDDDGLDRSDEIATSHLEPIDDSAASIVIISPNYASSHWCLEELAKICECRRLILPVFYKVDPSDVQKQTGPFEAGFRSHKARFKKEEWKVVKWREAMKKVRGIAGFVANSTEKRHHMMRCSLIQPPRVSHHPRVKVHNLQVSENQGLRPYIEDVLAAKKLVENELTERRKITESLEDEILKNASRELVSRP